MVFGVDYPLSLEDGVAEESCRQKYLAIDPVLFGVFGLGIRDRCSDRGVLNGGYFDSDALCPGKLGSRTSCGGSRYPKSLRMPKFAFRLVYVEQARAA